MSQDKNNDTKEYAPTTLEILLTGVRIGITGVEEETRELASSKMAMKELYDYARSMNVHFQAIESIYWSAPDDLVVIFGRLYEKLTGQPFQAGKVTRYTAAPRQRQIPGLLCIVTRPADVFDILREYKEALRTKPGLMRFPPD